ncbi:aminopeptidase [Clostridium sp. YIM B02515]|uniref:Aminopeptidase n=1 Tax=Clostridium rhizosphaerae TaxID=2803861 RepID=A0ABS1TAW4_9CLOT|nr:aminopeptidase [Clostridium rhizosphaerae]MBL4936496.1 aminopeptidase [Clostridium rhizosphaerae]
MENFKENLEKYAELAVKVGINIQKGQTLVINAPLPAAEFVRAAAKKAYEAGAKNVHVEWADEEVTRIKYLNAPEEAFSEYPMWRAQGLEEMAKEGAGFLSISASNPDLLKGVDPERISVANKTASKALDGYRSYVMADKAAWCVISVPTKEWAAKVFPDADAEKSVEKLWENIFKATRVDRENPVEAWKDHTNNLNSKLDYLNSKNFKKLHYKSPVTDLTIELPEKHLWAGGGSNVEGGNYEGTYFVANMPTEEVFTMPKRDGVNGTVRSTKPLNYSGNLIDNFTLKFENGKVVDFSAEQGYETLKKLIETDEGSHYLGEVALVPHDSPISNTNIIFFNTLFDENASCHFALGKAYPTNLEGGASMSEEELTKNGANTSLTHVDFMVGSPDLNIDGETADGKLEPIFRNGNWAF